MTSNTKFTPALKFHKLTTYYDWVVKWTSKEQLFKQKLIKQAMLSDNMQVIDVGCGTGSLLHMLIGKQNNIKFYGVDIDSKALAVAKNKLKNSKAQIKLYQISVTQLPFEQQSIDRVFCSLMFHHLTDIDKIKTLKEIYRVLKSDGELHFSDWGKPSSKWVRWRFFIVQLLDGFVTTHACLSNFVVEKMQLIGFTVLETERFNALVGDIVLLKATKEK